MNRNGYKTLGQQGAKQLLTYSTGYVQLQIADEQSRNIVDDQAINLRRHLVLRLTRPLTVAKKDTVAVDKRPRDQLAVNGQCNKSAGRWHRQVAGTLIPLEAPVDAVAARRQLQARYTVVQDHCSGLAIDCNGIRPVRCVAR